jgi:hypothetical protein
MSWDVFIESVERIKIIFRYPWTYNLTVFIKGELEQDTDKVWQRLADFMIGADHTSVLLGSYAVNALADSLEGRVLTEPEKEALSGNLEKSVYTRADNAKFISETFDDERLIEAAEILQNASDIYAAIDINDNQGMVARLRECAEHELSFGEKIYEYLDE